VLGLLRISTFVGADGKYHDQGEGVNHVVVEVSGADKSEITLSETNVPQSYA